MTVHRKILSIIVLVVLLLTLVSVAIGWQVNKQEKDIGSDTETALIQEEVQFASAVQSANNYINLSADKTKFATVFFYWHWCGEQGDEAKSAWRQSVCREQSTAMPYIIDGISSPSPKFGFYGERNYEWLLSEFADMETALLDYVLIDSWKVGAAGDSEPPNLSVITEQIVRAINEQRTKLKFGIFLEGGGILGEYNRQRGLSGSKISLSSNRQADEVIKLYTDQIFHFFDRIPRSAWANTPAGKPYVLFFDYQNSIFENRTKRDYLPYILSSIKTQFTDRYKVEPALVPIWEWLYQNIDYSTIYKDHMSNLPWQVYGTAYRKQITDIIEGSFSWSTYGAAQSLAINSLHIGNVSPGFNKCNWLKINDARGDGAKECSAITGINKLFHRREGRLLQNNFLRLNNQVGFPFDLVIFESWGEIYEGTTLQRAKNYPKLNIQNGEDFIQRCNNTYNTTRRDQFCLPEDFYIQKVRYLISTFGPTTKRGR